MMISKTTSIDRIEKIGAIAGILSIILYISAAVLSFVPDSIARLMGFTFPLLWIIAYMGLYRFLKKQHHTPSLEIGYLFGIIGASIACSFIVVQQANFMWHDMAIETASSEEVKALYQASFRGANRVQAGLDVAFDIFITIAWFLFGLNIAKSPSFNKFLGYSGSLIAFGLLTLNLYTFPNAPAESGLFDLGPFLGLWTLVVFIWFLMVLRKEEQIAN